MGELHRSREKSCNAPAFSGAVSKRENSSRLNSYSGYGPLILTHRGRLRRRLVGGVGKAAPAGVLRKHISGRPRVTVRPNYVGLPARAGRGPDEPGRKPGGSGGAHAPVRSRKHGPEAQNRRGGAPKGDAPAGCRCARRKGPRSRREAPAAEATRSAFRRSASLGLSRARRHPRPPGSGGHAQSDRTRTHRTRPCAGIRCAQTIPRA